MALTLGAATVTLLIVIVVLTGPTVVECFNQDNMGQCLRGKITGTVPPPVVAEADPATAIEPAPQPVIAAPATLPTPAAEPPATPTDSIVATTFGLLRAEPDGSLVIAGSGAPGAEVEVFANGELLGQTTVEPSGDWVLVPDAPLPPGGAELTLGQASGEAAQSFVVVIDADKTSEPLVVASTPGAASEVLQGLAPPPARTEAMIASVDPAPRPQPAPVPLEPASPQPETAALVTPEPRAPQPAAPVSPPAVASAPAVAATAPVTASAPPAPTIDAIEIEGQRTFFGGAGPEGSILRLYVDDTFIADTTVSDGRWLVEAGNALTRPSQRIRIDLLTDNSADVAARAEVDFVVDLPAAPSPDTLAEADPAADPVAPPAPQPDAQPPQMASAAEPTATDADSVPTMVATAIGDPEAQRFASGNAIIRTGDNLWTIARRVYGAGIRYTTIYEANTTQIRDPNRIYPGQVFALPDAE